MVIIVVSLTKQATLFWTASFDKHRLGDAAQDEGLD